MTQARLIIRVATDDVNRLNHGQETRMAVTCSRSGDDTSVSSTQKCTRTRVNRPCARTFGGNPRLQERYRHGNTALIWMQSVTITKPAILLPPCIQQSCELKLREQIVLYCDNPARDGH